uniref:Uncharacterized protein n=1 Tax=Candidatus Kentrum sp. LFY TaxID=2126342 RepID=A0A450WM02_9GAMM|nr:MAG: hypothetical protein BECKLFY1418C_GA0070996_103819 [Candidatus Kentron sp. LFY]
MTDHNSNQHQEEGADLAGWKTTRNAISDAWNENHRLRRDADFSSDPDSDYQKYTRNMNTLINDHARHADTGLRIVDQAVATSQAREALEKAARDADEETNRIARATNKLEQAIKAVDAITRAVGIAARLVALV